MNDRSPTTSFFRSALSVGVAAVLAFAAADARGQSAVPENLLYVAQEFGADPTPVFRHAEFTAVGSPDWSPDGARIACDAWRPAAGETFQDARVLVVNADGSELTDLGDGAMPSWSADGGRIVFSRYQPTRGVWIMNADGSGKSLLDGDGWGGRWSPDGKTIAYTVRAGGRGDVRLRDVESGKTRLVFDGRDARYETVYWSFAWSPDSKRLCFRGQTADGPEIATAVIDGEAADVRVLQRGGGSRATVSWHPDGDRVAVALSSPEHGGIARVFTVPADGSDEPSPLPGLSQEFTAVSPDWSPDGRRILFVGGPRPAPGTP